MKRGLIAGFLFILLIGVASAVSCVEGGYMDPLDCRLDDFSCMYSHMCAYQGPGTCLGPPCASANFDANSCKTACSLVDGEPICYNCVYDLMTGLCNQLDRCDQYAGIFCLIGLRKCSDDFSLKQFCNGLYWETEENCSSINFGVCSANYNFEFSTIDTSCIPCDMDGDGFLIFREFASACPSCSGSDCDCNDYNAAINPAAIENCTNLLDDNCNGLIDGADPHCNESIEENESFCNDTDGYNISVKGVALNETHAFADACLTTGELVEYLCSNGSIVNVTLTCPNNLTCLNGTCASGISNETNETNCTEEGEYLTNELLEPCCEGLTAFPLTTYTDTGGCCGIFENFMSLFRPTGHTVVSEQAVCYNESKGPPSCQKVGTMEEGWYYEDGDLLLLGICALDTTCLDASCLTNRQIDCSKCGTSFKVAVNSFKVYLRRSTPQSVKDLNLSDTGIDLIKQFECFRAKRYTCPAGKPTIGYGHVIKSKTETFEGVNLWSGTITKEQGHRLLMQDAKFAEDAIKKYIRVSLNQNQYDALSSFIFNVGTGNFKKSTLMKKLNLGDYNGAAEQFPRWNKGGGQVLNGLVRRRAAERELFEKKEDEEEAEEPDDGGVG